MLKPFLIRDLHNDPLSENIVDDSESDLYNATDVGSVTPQQRHGRVELSAADYDEIAYIHPQARLSYLDEDDGETITVGSSLELTQRLDEPPPRATDASEPETIHLFDIRRSKSVTDLWKRAACPDIPLVKETLQDTAAISGFNSSHTEKKSPDMGEDDTSESFLSAFETEMAKVMEESSADAEKLVSENAAAESSSSSRTEQAEPPSDIPLDPAQAFDFAMRNLVQVAVLLMSGVKSKLPELERHLDNARRALPRDMTDTMRKAFTIFEEQVKAMATTINNIPEAIRGENRTASVPHFPEFPAPQDAIRGLRDMGGQLGEMGQTLVDTFESSIRGAFPGYQDSPFFNFPGFSDSNNQHTTMPGDAPADYSTRSDNIPSESATLPNNLPARPTFEPQSPEVLNQQAHSFRQMPQRVPHSRPVRPPYAPGPFFAYPRSRFERHTSWGSPSALGPPYTRYERPGNFEETSSARTAQPQQLPAELPSTRPSFDSESTRSLFIGNLGFNVTERMIKDVFTSKGLAVDVNLPSDFRTNKHAGFGYLTFDTATDAALALRDVQGMVVDGHCVNLEYLDHAPITSVIPLTRAEGPDFVTPSSPQTSGIVHHDSLGLDSSTNSSNNALPSRPGANINPSTPRSEVVHDILAQAEARFPPVSQLDAHMLAGQSSEARPSVGTNTASNLEEDSKATSLEESYAVPRYLPGSFPRDIQEGPISRTPAAPQRHPLFYPRVASHQHHHPQQPHSHLYPRRAATVRSVEPHRNFPSFAAQAPLRRRATEHHSLRGGPHMAAPLEPGVPRHRASFHHMSPPEPQNTSTGEPRVQVPEANAPIHRKQSKKQRGIDDCVAALAKLGYGNEGDGGLQRMEIYAAAAKGELVDAIEMIEEERKAYEQRV
ncbi:hypothetical protein BJX99DRAFT_216959 [Aspergillus californicus]